MALPTERDERMNPVGPWVRQLNIDELREELSDTVRAIRGKIAPVAISLGIAAAAGVVCVIAMKMSGDAHD